MIEPLNILVIEDSNADFLMLERHLKQKDLAARCRRVDSFEGVKEAIANENWDLVLSDYSIPKLNFLDSLNLIQLAHPNLPVIMVSGTVGEELAVEILKLGVSDFVLKENLSRLVPAVQRALKEKRELEERRRTQESLRESEAMYHSLFENMLNGFALCRMIFAGDTPQDFLYLSVNKAFEKQTGLKDVTGRRATEVMPGIRETDAELIEIYGRVTLTGKPEQFEIYVEALQQWFWISAYSPAKEHFVAVFEVITERKQAERALAVSEERFQLAMRGAHDGLWDWNLKTNELYYSPRWKLMLGYADEEIIDCYDSWERLLHPDDLKPTLKQLHDFLNGRTAKYENEFRMRHKEGHYVDILSRAFLVNNDQGEAIRMVGTHVDLTESRKLEAQFRQSQKMESIGTLAGGIAHDFNNILSAILGYAELALENLAADIPAHKYVHTIIEAGLRASHLTKDLLLFSRKQVSDKRSVDVNSIITKVEKFVRRVIGEDIQCATYLAKQSILIFADEHQVEQVLMNFATNARDAMPSGGSFSITTECMELDQDFIETHGLGSPGPYALITVSDTGKGMDKQTVEKIFEPFFTTKEMGRGTGLGLAVVYGIIKEHQGYINVDSEPEKGTVFRVYLPLIDEKEQTAQVQKEIEKPRGGTETVLLAEDEVTVRQLFSTVLEQNGYTVIEAVNGEDAVRKFAENKDKIDLLLFDLIMPKMNGKLALEAIRRLKPGIKGVFVSGYAPENIQQRELFDLQTEVLFKPVSPKELLKTIRKVLDALESPFL